MVDIEQLLNIFSKAADNFHKRVYPPQHRPVTKLSIAPHKVRQTLTKLIPWEQPNIIDYDDGKSPTSLQRNVHMSPSGPHIILLDVPVPPPSFQPAQPPRVDTEGPSSNLRSRGKKIISPTLHWQHNSKKLENPMQLPIKYMGFPRNIDIW